MDYYKNGNDRIRFNSIKNCYNVITFKDITYSDGITETVKDLTTYGPGYTIPDGFVLGVKDDWIWGLTKLRGFITGLSL